jgi:hypothetical protein
MTTKDLIFAANILLDYEEMTREGDAPVLDHIHTQCAKFKITEVQDELIKIVSKCMPVYNVGRVSYDFENEDIV